MSNPKHDAKLYDVQEGDSVNFTTTSGATFDGRCSNYQIQYADERTGEVRTTMIWDFTSEDRNVIVSILNGLKSSDADPDFPLHKASWESTTQTSIGYIKDLEIE